MPLKETQPSMTIEEQIKNLDSLKLKIEDREFAKSFLNDISYFRLIKAYSLGLKPKDGDYYENVSFNQIVDLYMFNCNFRQILFPFIERIEVNLRCRLSNYFSNNYGPLGYENSDSFKSQDAHKIVLDDITSAIEKNKKAPFIKNFKTNYKDGKIPIYAIIELLSFGELSRFYRNLKNKDKKVIAKTFGIGYTYLESWIESIAYVRNICAHYGRLYNAKLSKAPMLYDEYTNSGIENYRVYSVLLCIYHLVPHDIHWIAFVDQIELLFEKHSSVDIKTMGFPVNWYELLMRGQAIRPSETHKLQ